MNPIMIGADMNYFVERPDGMWSGIVRPLVSAGAQR